MEAERRCGRLDVKANVFPWLELMAASKITASIMDFVLEAAMFELLCWWTPIGLLDLGLLVAGARNGKSPRPMRWMVTIFFFV